jgi:hypothetical protein
MRRGVADGVDALGDRIADFPMADYKLRMVEISEQPAGSAQRNDRPPRR